MRWPTALLIKYETIDEEQIHDIMAGREPRPPKDWEEPAPHRRRQCREAGTGHRPAGQPDLKPPRGSRVSR